MFFLIENIASRRLLYLGIFFGLASLCLPANADTTLSAQSFLEEPKVAAVGGGSEIAISFSTEIRYIRHVPEGSGDTLRVSIEIVNPCDAEELLSQESKWLPKTDWYVPFTATFPESIRRTGTTTGVCNATRNRVYIGHTLLVKFAKETTFKVRPGSDKRSIIITTPILKNPENEKVLASVKAPEVLVVAPAVESKVQTLPIADTPKDQVVAETPALPAPAAEPELPPADLMMAGRTALSAGDSEKATQIFNRLLNLPQNIYSQEAQELVGMAREKSGDIEKAKAEYILYITLYPQGEASERVKKRLAGLEAIKTLPTQALKEKSTKRPVKEIHQNTFTGSLSQYYYGGKSQTTNNNVAADEITKTNSTDQSALITNISATERFRNNQYDTKIVFRDTEVKNFKPGIRDRNTLSAAYIEHTNKAEDYLIRVGRQSGTSQGVLGRFDGAFGRYGISPTWHITGVVGQPDDGPQSQVQTKRHFYGVGVEFGPLAEKWGGSVYGIQQVADGLVERRAVGTELRYFSGTTSWFTMLDYDTVYQAINIAMLQGNWQTASGYNFNLLLDHRRSPILYAEMAIQAGGSFGARSVSDLRNFLSADSIYSYVKGVAPISNMAMLSMTKQVTQHWQVGGDVRYMRSNPTDGAFAIGGDVIPSQPGTGSVWAYTVQAVGTDTLFKNDTSVIMASFISDPTYDSQNFSLVNSQTLREKYRIDTALRFYHEKRDTNATTWKVTPSARFNYYFRDNLSFEAELLVDRTHTDDPVSTIKTDSWRETLFAGYRWDIR